MQKERIKSLTEDQQRAILSIFFSMCIDKNGYLIPDHFGSGINLIEMNAGKSNQASVWVTPQSIKKYTVGKALPKLESNTKTYPIYLLIMEHKRVFFNGVMKSRLNGWEKAVKCFYSKEIIMQVIKKIATISKEARQQVLCYLKDEFYLGLPHNTKDRDYFKLISEYIDILSLKLPIATSSDFSKGHIYRIAYEICSNSNGKYLFSNKFSK